MLLQAYPFIEPEYLIPEKEIEIPPYSDIEFIHLLEPLKINHPIVQLLLYLDKHSDDKLYLEDIVAESGLSKRAFCKAFLKITRTSFSSYMVRLRLHKAMYLLMNSNYSTYQVSIICGFNTYSNFLEYFKKCYGVQPKKRRSL